MTDAISSTTSTVTNAAQNTTTQSNTSALSSDFETFLKMLTAQMQNQDPLNPIESTDYAVQLATFSGVEQQVRTNDLLADLTNQFGGSGFAEHAGWVGMLAGIDGPAYFDSTPIEFLPQSAAGADTIVVNVMDASGNVVQSTTMEPSSDVLMWAGTDEDGNAFADGFYTFEVESYRDGTLVETNLARTYSSIFEARNTTSGTVFVLRGGTEISPESISSLREALF